MERKIYGLYSGTVTIKVDEKNNNLIGSYGTGPGKCYKDFSTCLIKISDNEYYEVQTREIINTLNDYPKIDNIKFITDEETEIRKFFNEEEVNIRSK